MSVIKKSWRFVRIYGFSRTIVKIAGRTRSPKFRLFFPKLLFKPNKRSTSLIGCGQFGFSTISFFLYKNKRNQFLDCYDVDEHNALSAAKFWGFNNSPLQAIFDNPHCSLIYIASNHASHTEYAIKALKRNISVYIEKPVSVSRTQLQDLCLAVKSSKGDAHVGYNRPFSQAIKTVNSYISNNNLPLSVSCFITGHFIDKDHWYRNPEEGTRVCGNMGHWIDLTVYLMVQRGRVPDELEIQITYGSKVDRDDNVIVNFSSSLGDIVTICLTARAEPFEGINETINIQSGDFIAKIDDFRTLKVWNKTTYFKKRHWPKDVGHKRAILQPFREEKREFKEIVLSSLIMLEVRNMIELGISQKTYYPLNDSIYKDYII